MAEPKKKILVVDDDDSLSQMYVDYLTIKGFDTKRVADGEQALTGALEYKPDLILLDIMMPNINGFDVLDILRNTPKTAHVPVIMLSALSAKDDIERARKLGVNDFLEKSTADLKTMVEKINQHING